MKEFLKFTFASFIGIAIFATINLLIGIMVIGSILAADSTVPPVPENSVLALNLNGYVVERNNEQDLPIMKYLGTEMDYQGLDMLTEAISKAKDNSQVKGMYIELGPVSFDSPATMIALRRALNDFKKSGKWIVAYGDVVTQGAYYVASAADKLYLNTTGQIEFKGLGRQTTYLKGLYDKIGVKYQTVKVGKYKSFVESNTRTNMSDEDREQRLAYMNGIWNIMTDDIAQSRHIEAARLKQYANDSILMFAQQKDYLQMKLIDGLLYPEEVKAEVQKRLGLDKDDDIMQISTRNMALAEQPKKKDNGDEVAVYYAIGDINDMDLSNLTGETGIVGKTMAADLRELADDDDVKAVVIRVNSGGGSAVASEQIHHAVELLKKKKPVVVSMGGAAASGGYMISCGASHIIAEPATITGSIGIFGMIPNISSLMTDKLGITYDEVSTSKYTNAVERLVTAKNNEQELKFLQNSVDWGYDRFISMVAQGRQLTKERVHEIAQGRVWLGKDAVKLGLVDQLGSLDDAVKKAAELAKLDDYHPQAYPELENWTDRLMKQLSDNNNYLESAMRELWGSHYHDWVMLRTASKRNRLQAALPFSIVVE